MSDSVVNKTASSLNNSRLMSKAFARFGIAFFAAVLLVILDYFLVLHHPVIFFAHDYPTEAVLENLNVFLQFRMAIMLFLTVILFLFSFLLYFPRADRSNHMEGKTDISFRYFLFFPALVLLLGAAYIIVITPMSVPDEHTHYSAAYQISNYLAFHDNPTVANAADFDYPKDWENHNMPSAWLRLFADFFKAPENLASIHIDVLSGIWTLQYPLEYLPQAIGILLARLLGFNFLQLFYFGRFVNLLFYSCCVGIAIKRCPQFKLMLGLVAALPMALQQAASYSYDAFINGISLILVASLLKACIETGPFSRRDYLWIMLSSILLAPAKGAYFFLILLFPAIPVARFRSRKQKITLFLGLIFCAGLFFLLMEWSSIVRIVSASVNERSTQSLSEILRHPFTVFALLRKTINENLYFWLRCAVGYCMSGLTLYLENWLPEAFYVLLLLSVLSISEESSSAMPKRYYGYALLVIVFVLFSFLFAMLITWTNQTSSVIEGVQGRYLLPVLPLLLLLFRNHTLILKRSIDKPIIFIYILLSIRVILCIIDKTLQI